MVKQPPSRMSRQRFVLIGILFLFSVNMYMDRACIASAVDFIKKDLSLTGEMMGLILGIFAVGYALFQIPSGWVADYFGARKALTLIVTVWSVFTALTGLAQTAFQMLSLRFLFGAGEAGAFPGAAQAFFRWLPVRERGLAHGINFSGSRLGAAFSLFLMPWLIAQIGWRWTFGVNGLVGILWAILWLVWFRDNPKDNPRLSPAELEVIEQGRRNDSGKTPTRPFSQVFTSLNMSLSMVQYFASNVTFFITLTWLPSYIKSQWPNDPRAIYYSAIPLAFAAVANWIAGSMVTGLYKRGFPVGSRRITAIIGFVLGIVGLVLATQSKHLSFLNTDQAQMCWFVFSFSLATFGVDMTLSPSWAFCNDIGGANSGAISGSMNMVGNIGAALSAIMFPFFVHPITKSANAFFFTAAAINLVAILAWCGMNPQRTSDIKVSPAAIRRRFMAMLLALVLFAAAAVGANLYLGTKKVRDSNRPDPTKQLDSSKPTPTPDRQPVQ